MIRKLIEFIINKGLSFFPELVEIVPISFCYFIKEDIPSSIKINPAFVHLNYKSVSPFAKSDLVFCVDKEELYLWFINREYDKEASYRIVFPESYLMAKSFKAEQGDRIVLVEREDKVEVVVICNDYVVSQFEKKQIAGDTSLFIELLTKEHGLVSPELIEISVTEKEDLIRTGLYNVNLSRLRGFLYKKENVKDNGPVLVRIFLMSLIVFLSCTIMSQVSTFWFMKHRVAKENAEFDKLRRESEDMMLKRSEALRSNKYWLDFSVNELDVPSLEFMYLNVAKVVDETGAQLLRWQSSRDSISTIILVADAADFVSKLRLEIENVEIKFTGAVKKDKRTGLQKAVLLITPQKK